MINEQTQITNKLTTDEIIYIASELYNKIKNSLCTFEGYGNKLERVRFRQVEDKRIGIGGNLLTLDVDGANLAIEKGYNIMYLGETIGQYLGFKECTREVPYKNFFGVSKTYKEPYLKPYYKIQPSDLFKAFEVIYERLKEDKRKEEEREQIRRANAIWDMKNSLSVEFKIKLKGNETSN